MNAVSCRSKRTDVGEALDRYFGYDERLRPAVEPAIDGGDLEPGRLNPQHGGVLRDEKNADHRGEQQHATGPPAGG